jgi:aspartate/methionine/tyrosine aminotransferase
MTMTENPSIVAARMRGIEKTLIRRMHQMANPSCLDLGLGELRFPTPRAILDHVREGLGTWTLGYTANEGYPELRSLIAARSPFPVTPDRVGVTAGAQEALMAVLMAVVDPGDEVLVPDPGFPAYATLIKIAGGAARTYPLRREHGFMLRAADVLAAVGPRTKAVLVNSPSNPTGAVAGAEELRALAAGLEERGVLAISDEVYRQIAFGDAPPPSFAALSARCAVVDSLSKSHCMTGWRVGWYAVPEDIAKAVATFHTMAVTCIPAVSQRAAIFALKGGGDAERARNLSELRDRRDLAVATLRTNTDLGCVVPAGAFYLFVDVSAKWARFGGSLDIALALLEREKVVTIPGVAFGSGGEGWLRLSFAPEPAVIEEGIRRIGRFLAE